MTRDIPKRHICIQQSLGTGKRKRGGRDGGGEDGDGLRARHGRSLKIGSDVQTRAQAQGRSQKKKRHRPADLPRADVKRVYDLGRRTISVEALRLGWCGWWNGTSPSYPGSPIPSAAGLFDLI